MVNSTFSLALIGVVPAVCDAEAGESGCRELSLGAHLILTNNCEHLCEWRVQGEHRSYQVDRWLSWLLRVFGAPKPVLTFARFFKSRTAASPKLIA